jgi:hypothetical protein
MGITSGLLDRLIRDKYLNHHIIVGFIVKETQAEPLTTPPDGR